MYNIPYILKQNIAKPDIRLLGQPSQETSGKANIALRTENFHPPTNEDDHSGDASGFLPAGRLVPRLRTGGGDLNSQKLEFIIQGKITNSSEGQFVKDWSNR